MTARMHPSTPSTSPVGKPAAEVQVTEELVRSLLERQHPDLAAQPVRAVDEGWDNFTFRLGSTRAVRLPRRLAAVPLLEKEQQWLPRIASWIPLDVPAPLRVGVPSELFPWPWSVVPWIDGASAERAVLSESDAVAVAASLRSLHRAAEREAPTNPVRGVPLVERDPTVRDRLERLGSPGLVRIWERAAAAPNSSDRVWLHGDLHARNVIVRDGSVAGLIDWGDLAAGDPATDLACAWTLFDEPARLAFFDAYGPTSLERTRALGWAVSFASALLDSGDGTHVRMGRAIARRILETPNSM